MTPPSIQNSLSAFLSMEGLPQNPFCQGSACVSVLASDVNRPLDYFLPENRSPSLIAHPRNLQNNSAARLMNFGILPLDLSQFRNCTGVNLETAAFVFTPGIALFSAPLSASLLLHSAALSTGLDPNCEWDEAGAQDFLNHRRAFLQKHPLEAWQSPLFRDNLTQTYQILQHAPDNPLPEDLDMHDFLLSSALSEHPHLTREEIQLLFSIF